MKRRPLSQILILMCAAGLLAVLTGRAAISRADAAQPAKAAPAVSRPTHTTPKPLKPVASGVRMKWQDFVKDKNRLNAFIRAVQVMKSRTSANPNSVDYRTSWEYWSSMHGFYGPDALAGLLQNAINAAPPDKRPFYNGLRDLTYPAQPAGLAAKVWDKCEHGTPAFPTWHRMFLFYFERVLQGAAKDPSLRLPYWDYTDPAQIQLPAEFAQPKLPGGGDNPLYDVRRRSQTVKLNPNQTNIDNLLKESDYNDFEPDLEQQPHGTTHCTVGPGCPYPLMGDVPVAGTDPIFWLHHANIDRIFECWIQLGGQVPSELEDQSFSFLDENGSMVTLMYKDLPIDYVYDHVESCGRKATRRITPVKGLLAAAPPTPVGQVEGFKIGSAEAAVALPLTRSGPPATQLHNSLLAPAGAARTELVLKDVTIATAPGVLFDVYLSTTGANPRRQYVATLSFFNQGHHGKQAAAITRHLDVTDALQALKGKSAEVPAVQVVFEATDGTAGSTLGAVRGLFNPQSGLRVGTIRLEVKGGK